MDRRWKDSMA
jgi:hypothetical protein